MGTFLKMGVSEIRVKLIRVNQGLSVLLLQAEQIRKRTTKYFHSNDKRIILSGIF